MKLLLVWAACCLTGHILLAGPIRLADPTIFPYQGKYYLYGTGNAGKGFTVQVSTDLKSWSDAAGAQEGYALLKGDAFGEKGFWAPQIFQHKGKFYMAYTADEQIAIAVSDSPLGPFKQTEKHHLAGDGKKIDPFIFRDKDGQLYLYHVRLEKGNRLFVARLKPDLSDILPETLQPVLHATDPWENTENREWTVTEGPTVVLEKGIYFLLYSANDYRNKDYAVGFATSRSPLGPWTKHPSSPFISRAVIGINGTGHGDLFKDHAGNWQYVLHTHFDNNTVHPRLTGLVQVKFKAGAVEMVKNSFHYLEASSASVQNPVLNRNFADPTVIRVNDQYYAYATNTHVDGKLVHIQVARSADLQHWDWLGDALPVAPRWADKDFWAPHVLFDKGLGKYVMFYSGESVDTSLGKCIGVAFADRPEGPFTDMGQPLLSGPGFENIDPMVFLDEQTGKKWFYWGSGFQPIQVRELAGDYKTFAAGSKPAALLFPNTEKEYTRLLEGAWLDHWNGYYYLYYSGDNCCGNEAHYAVMVARSEKPDGPFQRLAESKAENSNAANGKPGSGGKAASSVILAADNRWLAPGHNSIVTDLKGHRWIAYHAIQRNASGPQQRVFCLNEIRLVDGWPAVVE